MGAKSFKNRIIFLLVSSLLIFGLVVVAIIYLYYKNQSNTIIETTKEKLMATAESQANTILISFLIPEQKGGIELLVNRIKQKEGLEESKIIAEQDINPEFKACTFASSATYCISEDNKKLGIIAPIKENDKIYGYYFKSKFLQLESINKIFFTATVFIVVTLIVTFLVSFLILLRLTSIDLPRYIADLTNWLSDVLANNNPNATIPRSGFQELDHLADRAKTIVDLHNKQRNEVISLQSSAAIGKMAAQVAHDVESPIKALEAISKDLANIPESHRVGIRNAIGRIQSISRKLLDKYAGRDTDPSINYNLVSSAIDNILLEKQAEYHESEVNFQTDISQEHYLLFAKFNSIEIKEILSNLINNAVESFADHIQIRVTLKQHVIITIQDNGKGIPKEMLENVFELGVSYEKEQGTGLGLAHAKHHIESWGGQITLCSEPNVGTTVTLKLRHGETPQWFPKKIVLMNSSTVVIVDDDKSMHYLWNSHFSNNISKDGNINFYNHTDPKGLITWCQNNTKRDNTLFLVDYEFANSNLDGIELIKMLGIEKQSILVTSRFDEAEIQTSCQKENIRLLSKTVASYIPIEVIEQLPDLVLLDDCDSLTTAWEMQGRIAGKKIATFNRVSDFLIALAAIDKETPIYIDSDLQEDQKGEEVAKCVFEQGYKNIYLSTGYQSKKSVKLPWIKEVVGKEPPSWS